MSFIDVTVAVSEETPVYKGDPQVKIDRFITLSDGDPANVTMLCFGAHTGTHVDAPNHFIDGTRRVDELELEKMIGPCRVVELEGNVQAIEPQHLPGLEGIERILFKTRNSSFWNDLTTGFRTDFTFITPEAAQALAGAGIKLVGIDYLSVEKFGSTDFAAHIALLQKEVVIIEGLDLRAVTPGDYEIICLPLKYNGGNGDGAPARTILRKQSPA